MIDLLLIPSGVLLGSLAWIGAITVTKWIRQKVRVYRVGKELQAMHHEAYRAHRTQVPRLVHGCSRSVWEGESENR